MIIFASKEIMLINQIIETIGYTRNHFLKLTSDCSAEEMNTLPKGFRNNLIWNLAHVISSQQMLCYVLSNVAPVTEQVFVDAYKPGTSPGSFIDQPEIMRIRVLAETTVAELIRDYNKGAFKAYDGRQTKFGPLLSNIEEAIAYVSTHETLHLGYAKAMLRVLRSETNTH